MRKSVFIALFLALTGAFMYAPVEKVSSFSQDTCFPNQNINVLNFNELPKEIPVTFNYGNLQTSWKTRVESSGIILLSNNVNSNRVFQQEYIGAKASLSSERCEFYSFKVKRDSGVLAYNLPLEREDRDAEGRKMCYYRLSDEAVKEISGLGGGAVALNDICPELVNGRLQAEGEECASSAECSVTINSGGEETFALGVEKDYCGKQLIYELNNGNKISSEEIGTFAQDFISKCQRGESAKEKLFADSVAGSGGSGNGGGGPQAPAAQNTGVRCCTDQNQNAPRDPCADSSVLGKLGWKPEECNTKFKECFKQIFGKDPFWINLDWITGRKVVQIKSITFSVRKYGFFNIVVGSIEGAAKQKTQYNRYVDEEGNLIGQSVSIIESIESSASGSDISKTVAEVVERKLKDLLSNEEISEISANIKRFYNEIGAKIESQIDSKTGKISIILRDKNGVEKYRFSKTLSGDANRQKLIKLLLEEQDIINERLKPGSNGKPDLRDDIGSCTGNQKQVTLTIIEIDSVQVYVNGVYNNDRDSCGDNQVTLVYDDNLQFFFNDLKNKMKLLLKCLGTGNQGYQ